jgi:cell division protein FtsB
MEYLVNAIDHAQKVLIDCGVEIEKLKAENAELRAKVAELESDLVEASYRWR